MSKWIIAGIGAALLLLNLGLADLLSFGLVKPSLTLPFIVYLGLKKGSLYGTITGLCLGLCEDLLGGTAAGSTALAFSIIGFMAGKLWSGGPFRVQWPWGGFLLGSALLFEIIRHLVLSREIGYPLGTLFVSSGLPSALYTTALGILWFLSPLHRNRIQ